MQAAAPDANAFILERLVGDTGEPERIIEAARSLAERAAKPLQTGIGEYAARPVPVEFHSAEVGRIAETAAAIGEFDALVIAASAHSPDALYIRIDALGISTLVDAYLGAEPDQPAQALDRVPSGIEIELAMLAIKQVAQALNGSGQRALQVKFPLPAPVTGAELKKLKLRDGPSVQIRFAIGQPASAGYISVTMPQRVLMKPRAGDEIRAPGVAGGASNEWSARFGEEVRRSTVTLEATVPMGKMTLGELSRLVEGQVLEMPETAPSETRLAARNRVLFLCEFGRLGQNYTVRIKNPYDTNQDLMDGLLSA